MGSSDSKAIQPDTTGNVQNSNNFIFSDSENTSQYYYYSEILLSIMTVIKLVELAYILYSGYIRKIKKKYSNSSSTA